MKCDNNNYTTNKFLKPYLRNSLSICSFVLAVLISNLAFASSANAGGVKFCNDGNDTLYFVVAKEGGDGFNPPYDVQAWYYINPGSCSTFNLNSFGSHVYRAYVGFAQKDASGNFAMAPYLEKFRQIPPGVSLTDKKICLSPKENFEWRNTLKNLQQCPNGYGLAKLSLLLYPSTEYFRTIPWLTIYLTTKKGAQLQSIIPKAKEKTASDYVISGSEQFAKGDIDGAIKDYLQALILDPKNDTAYSNLGICYQEKGQNVLASQMFQKALAINPKNPSIYNNFGHFLLQEGKIDLAIELFQKATYLDPNEKIYQESLDYALDLKKDKNESEKRE